MLSFLADNGSKVVASHLGPHCALVRLRVKLLMMAELAHTHKKRSI